MVCKPNRSVGLALTKIFIQDSIKKNVHGHGKVIVEAKIHLVSTKNSLVETKHFGINRFFVETKNIGFVRKSIP